MTVNLHSSKGGVGPPVILLHGLFGSGNSLRDWMLHQGIRSAQFVGHSLGGKVAMQLALSQPQLVSALVVADIAPVAYPAHHDEVFAALEVLPLELEGRENRANAKNRKSQNLF